MKVQDIRFEVEGDSLWIIWMEKDHKKLYKADAKKLLKWLKKNFETV